jgi:hypothetical protein
VVDASQPTASCIHRLVSLADGGYVVVWNSYDYVTFKPLQYAQVFDADGNKQGGIVTVSSLPDTNNAGFPAVAGLSGGGYVVAWDNWGNDGDGWGTYMRLYDSSGNPVANETLVNTTTAGAEERPSVAALTAGGFVITWDWGRPESTRSCTNLAECDRRRDVYQRGNIERNNRGTCHHWLDGGYVVTWWGVNSAPSTNTYDVFYAAVRRRWCFLSDHKHLSMRLALGRSSQPALTAASLPSGNRPTSLAPASPTPMFTQNYSPRPTRRRMHKCCSRCE